MFHPLSKLGHCRMTTKRIVILMASQSLSKQIFGYGPLLLSSIFAWTIVKPIGRGFAICKHSAANSWSVTLKQNEDVSTAQLKWNVNRKSKLSPCTLVSSLICSHLIDLFLLKVMEKLICLMEYICLNYILALIICSESIITSRNPQVGEILLCCSL